MTSRLACDRVAIITGGTNGYVSMPADLEARR